MRRGAIVAALVAQILSVSAVLAADQSYHGTIQEPATETAISVREGGSLSGIEIPAGSRRPPLRTHIPASIAGDPAGVARLETSGELARESLHRAPRVSTRPRQWRWTTGSGLGFSPRRPSPEP